MKALALALVLLPLLAHAEPPPPNLPILVAKAKTRRGAGIALVAVGGLTLIAGLVCTGYGAGGDGTFGIGGIVLGLGIAGDVIGLGMLIPGAVLWGLAQRDLDRLRSPAPTVWLSAPILRF